MKPAVQRLLAAQAQMAPGSMAGRVRSAAPPPSRAGALRAHRTPRPTPGGREYATFVIGSEIAGYTARDVDFLCTGDNDQDVFDEAIFELPAWGGGILILDGTYDWQQRLDIEKDNVHLWGMGNSTLLVAGGSMSAMLSLEGTGQQVSLLAVDGNDLATQNVRVIAGATETELCRVYSSGAISNCFYVTGDVPVRTRFWYCTAKTAGGNGYHIESATSPMFVGCTGNSCIGVGLYLAGGDSDGLTVIVGGSFEANGDAGIACQSVEQGEALIITGANCNNNNNTGISLLEVAGASVVGNVASKNGRSNSGIGIDVDSTADSQVNDNVARLNGAQGIRVRNSSNNQIHDNKVSGNSQTTHNTYDGILVSGDSDDNWVQGNQVRHLGLAKQQRYGINVVNVGTAVPNTNVVVHNDLKNSGATASFNDAGTGTVTTLVGAGGTGNDNRT